MNQEIAACRTFHAAGPPLEPQGGRLHNLLRIARMNRNLQELLKSLVDLVFTEHIREPVCKNAARRGSGGVPHPRGYRTSAPACKF